MGRHRKASDHANRPNHPLCKLVIQKCLLCLGEKGYIYLVLFPQMFRFHFASVHLHQAYISNASLNYLSICECLNPITRFAGPRSQGAYPDFRINYAKHTCHCRQLWTQLQQNYDLMIAYYNKVIILRHDRRHAISNIRKLA